MYLASAGTLLALYYLVLLLWLSRHQVKRLLGAPLRQPTPPASPGVPVAEADAEDFLSYEALTLVASRIRHGILMEAGKNASKPDLLRRIHALMASQGGLRLPASRGALHQFIVQQAQELCGLALSEAELEEAWQAYSLEAQALPDPQSDVSQVNP